MTLTGRTSKRTLDEIEIVSSDNNHVLRFVRDSEGGLSVTMRESTAAPYYDPKSVRFYLNKRDSKIVGFVLSGSDAGDAADDISTERYQIKTAEPVEIFEKKDDDPDCSPIAVADAQAAAALIEKEARIEAVQFEMRLDHSRDRHTTADVAGCPVCDAKVVGTW